MNLKVPYLYRFFKKDRIIDQGVSYDLYIRRRNLWIATAVLSTIVPYLFPFIVSLCVGGYDSRSLFSNGEILLSSMALISPFVIEMYSAREYVQNILLFSTDILIWISQIMGYALIRYSNILKQVNSDEVSGVLSDGRILGISLFILALTVVCCYVTLCSLYYANRKQGDNKSEEQFEKKATKEQNNRSEKYEVDGGQR